MAIIKILPKNIFNISNYNITKPNKTDGTSGTIITTITSASSIGNNSWDYGGKYDTKTLHSDWLVRSFSSSNRKDAIRYTCLAYFSRREMQISTNNYINYNNIDCDIELKYDKIALDGNKESFTNNFNGISSTQWGNYSFTLPNMIAPTDFGNIEFTIVDGYIVITRNEPNSNDVALLSQECEKHMGSYANVSYAINPDTITETSFTAMITSPMLIDCSYELVSTDNAESNFPEEWEHKVPYGGQTILTPGYRATNLSATFETTMIEEISQNINYGTSPYYKFDENSFFRTDMIRGGKSLFYATSDDIISKWSNGRKSVKLKCSIGEYNDTEGNLALSTQNNSLSMFFKIGDIVEPYIVDGQGKTVPLSKKPDGNATQFEVLSVKLYTDGACWQDIELLETT